MTGLVPPISDRDGWWWVSLGAGTDGEQQKPQIMQWSVAPGGPPGWWVGGLAKRVPLQAAADRGWTLASREEVVFPGDRPVGTIQQSDAFAHLPEGVSVSATAPRPRRRPKLIELPNKTWVDPGRVVAVGWSGDGSAKIVLAGLDKALSITCADEQCAQMEATRIAAAVNAAMECEG